MTIRRAKKRKYIINDTRIKTCLRLFDDNVYTRLEFLKAVSHSVGAHSCDLYAEPTDSDGDSPDDDQEDTDAVADAGAATVNATAATAGETDNCELGVSGSAARTSPGAGAMRPSAILRIMYSSP